MRFIAIEEIGEIVSGSTPKTDIKEYWGGEIPWVTPKDISQLQTPYLLTTERRITQRGLESCSTKLLPKGSILLSSRAPIGLVAITNMEISTNQGFKSIILNEGFYPLYIYYILKYNCKQLNNLGTGTTFKELSRENLKTFKIPVPDISTQIKIATILDSIEGIMRQRKESISLLDEFLKSTFISSFGTPSQNPENFKVGIIRDAVSEVKYGTSKTANVTGKYIYLRMNNITADGYMNYQDLKNIDIDSSSDKEDYLVRKGDLLFNRTNSKDLVGKSAMFIENQEMIIAGYLLRVRTNSDANPWYLWGYLNSSHGKQTLKAMSKSIVGMANINAQEFQQIKILLPPIDLQNKYGQIANQAMEVRKQFVNSLEELKNLFRALNQKAFTGNLDVGNFKIDRIDKTYEDTVLKKEPVIKQKDAKEKKQKRSIKSRLVWEEVSIEQAANWIKEKYTGYHFNAEMIIRFLKDEHITTPDYYSSEELKKYPQLNETDDLKSMIFSALNGENRYLKLKQFFYDASNDDENLELTDADLKLTSNRSVNEMSGIYFEIEV